MLAIRRLLPLMRVRAVRRVAGWLALALMLVQVVATSDHLKTSALAAALGIPLEKAAAIDSMCRSGQSNPDADHDALAPCMICTLAGIAGNGAASAAPVLPAPPHDWAVQAQVCRQSAALQPPCLPYGANRGPPAA